MARKALKQSVKTLRPLTDNACIWCRVSTADQNYERQRQDLISFCASRSWVVVQEYKEVISGMTANGSRDELCRLMSDAKEGKFSRVVVTELSRISRDVLGLLTLIQDLKALGVSVVVQTIGIETLNADGSENMIANIVCMVLSQVSAIEHQWRKERCLSGIAAARLAGKHLGRPHGTKIPDSVILKKHSGVVRLLNRNLSIRQIAKLEGISHITVIKVKKIIKSQSPQST